MAILCIFVHSILWFSWLKMAFFVDGIFCRFVHSTLWFSWLTWMTTTFFVDLAILRCGFSWLTWHSLFICPFYIVRVICIFIHQLAVCGCLVVMVTNSSWVAVIGGYRHTGGGSGPWQFLWYLRLLVVVMSTIHHYHFHSYHKYILVSLYLCWWS